MDEVAIRFGGGDARLAQGNITHIVAFSGQMAQYLPADFDGPVLMDFVDVDSAKWSEYAPRHRWPLSWVYRREGRRLLAHERDMALAARRTEEVKTWATAQGISADSYEIYSADVAVTDSIVAAGQACLAHQGVPDVVIANAGISVGMDTADVADLRVGAEAGLQPITQAQPLALHDAQLAQQLQAFRAEQTRAAQAMTLPPAA